jgi:NAD(P)-dependent dehydrogenase (short-subunit alcohol dehydrogenase family)
MPGPTDTPLAQANKEMWLDFGSDFRAEAGVEAATPADQAHPLAFLCSDAASYINGQLLIVDAGWYSAGLSGAYPAITETVKFLAGRYG